MENTDLKFSQVTAANAQPMRQQRKSQYEPLFEKMAKLPKGKGKRDTLLIRMPENEEDLAAFRKKIALAVLRRPTAETDEKTFSVYKTDDGQVAVRRIE